MFNASAYFVLNKHPEVFTKLILFFLFLAVLFVIVVYLLNKDKQFDVYKASKLIRKLENEKLDRCVNDKDLQVDILSPNDFIAYENGSAWLWRVTNGAVTARLHLTLAGYKNDTEFRSVAKSVIHEQKARDVKERLLEGGGASDDD